MKLQPVLTKIFHIIFFASAFAFLGQYIPQTYYQYFDKTVYYEIKVPAPIEPRDYKACDMVDVYIIRKSLIDGQGDSIINLSLVKDNNGTRERVTTENRRVSITQGEGTIITHWAIHCDVKAGKYFFEGTIKYQVRGIDKYTPFYTDYFEVTE